MAKVQLESASRKFVLGSYQNFDLLQTAVISADGPSSLHSAFANASSGFKRHIATWSQDCLAIQSEASSEDDAAFFDTELDAVERVHQLWSLCDICLLNQRLGSEILNWLQLLTLDINVSQYIQLFQKAEHPEALEADGARLGFFEVVQALVLQGRLLSAWNILSFHSDMRNSLDTSDYVAIKQVFFTHPHPAEQAEDDVDQITPLLSIEAWRAQVERVRRAQRLILDDPMGDIFDIMEGNVLRGPTLSSLVHWEEAALALLLYSFNAPFSQSTVLRVFDEAVEAVGGGDAEGILWCRIVKEIVRGEPGPPLRVMCEQAAALADRGLGGASLVSLLSTSHLAQLLHLSLACSSSGDEGLENSIVWPQNDVGLVEELFLQTAERLSLLEAPTEVVLGYCMACPSRGLVFAQAYLTRREVRSDDEALAICDLLCSLDLVVSARVIASARGTWWLKTARNPCKAIHFYCIASDYSRATALLENSAWDLVNAVVDCGKREQGLFSALRIRSPFPQHESSETDDAMTDAAAADARILQALSSCESVSEAFESSCLAVLYETETFFAVASPMAQLLRTYSAVIRLARDSVYDDAMVDALRALVHGVAVGIVPLR